MRHLGAGFLRPLSSDKIKDVFDFMLDDLPDSRRLVGMKQVLRAAADGSAEFVLIAEDADDSIQHRVQSACMEAGISFRFVPSMKELGERCNIDVGAACAAILRVERTA